MTTPEQPSHIGWITYYPVPPIAFESVAAADVPGFERRPNPNASNVSVLFAEAFDESGYPAGWGIMAWKTVAGNTLLITLDSDPSDLIDRLANHFGISLVSETSPMKERVYLQFYDGDALQPRG